MATLSQKERDRIRKQLDSVKSRLLEMQSTQTPRPQVAGVSTTGLNAAQIGGASGIGFEDGETQDEISRQVRATTESGGSKSMVGEPISREQAARLVGGFGLGGIVDPNQFSGMSYGAAAERARAERAKRTGQVSFNTSFAFNPETLKQTQRAIDKFGFSLDDISNDPFEPKEFKDEESKNLIEITGRQIGQLFDTNEQLMNAYQTNQQFKQTLDKFIQKGGSLDVISKNISTPPVANELQTLQESLAPTQNIQSEAEYLASLRNPEANPQAEAMALEELSPESEIAQNEIARIANIPNDLKRLYFGDERTMGILQMRQQQAEERKRLIEEQERDAKRTVRERAQLSIEKNRADAEQQKDKIEENRLAAKNYMTARLAKLGALNTSGAAPLAIQTLETKYQTQVNTLETAYKFAEREIEVGLEEDLDEIENKADELILSIEEDLTLDTEKSMKEIFKARQDADKEIYRITEQYARRLRERTSKYTADLKKEAEKYAKKFAETASNGLDRGLFSLQKADDGSLERGTDKTPLDESYAEIKREIRNNMPSSVSSQIITELTDEQMVMFLEDYLNERLTQQQTIDPEQFFNQWKIQVGLEEDVANDPEAALKAKLGL